MPLPRRRLFAALLVVCLGTLTAPLDSAVNIAFPSITSAFGLKQADIRWVIISYVLTYTGHKLHCEPRSGTMSEFFVPPS